MEMWLKICTDFYSKCHLAVNPDVKNNENLIRSISPQYLTTLSKYSNAEAKELQYVGTVGSTVLLQYSTKV